MIDMIACACGCGKLISPKDKKGRPKRFFKGHTSKLDSYVEPETKKCGVCKETKLITLFYYKTYISKASGKKYKRFRFECTECCNSISRKYFEENGTELSEKQKLIWNRNKGNIDFHVKFRLPGWKKESKILSDLTVDYLINLYYNQDGLCYYTGENMIVGSKDGKVGYDSLSLDKLDPKLGYVQGNVVWCTYLANTVKQNMTEQEFYLYMQNILDRKKK